MEQPWRRIERCDRQGQLTDYVEVGQCGRCGRGVDREFPTEYREVRGRLVCRHCVPSLRDRLSA